MKPFRFLLNKWVQLWDAKEEIGQSLDEKSKARPKRQKNKVLEYKGNALQLALPGVNLQRMNYLFIDIFLHSGY